MKEKVKIFRLFEAYTDFVQELIKALASPLQGFCSKLKNMFGDDMLQKIDTKEWFIVGSLLAAVFVVAVFPIANYDVYWHLAFGKVEFLQKKVLSEEVFSYTMEGAPWWNHTWLSGLLFYLIYNFAGYNGLIIFKALMVSLIALVMIRLLRNKGYSYEIIAPLILLMAMLSMRRYFERPHIFTYLFISVTYFIVHSYVHRGIGHRALYLLAPIGMIWANLHSGVVFGVVVIFSFIMGEALKYLISNRKRFDLLSPFKEKRIRNLCLALLVFVLGTYVNPYGFKPMVSNFGPLISLIASTVVSGSVDVTYNQEFMRPIFQFFPFFWVVLGILTFLAVFRVKKIDISELAVLLPFIFLSLRYNRAIGMFGIVMLPVFASLIKGIVKSGRFEKVFLASVTFVLIAAIVNLKFLREDDKYRFGFGINKSMVPVDCVRFIVDNGISGNMYNANALGGYLEWMLYPERKIFIDGRTTIFKEVRDKMSSNGFLEEYNVNYTVVQNKGLERMLLMNGKDWALVFWDECCSVYLRKAPENYRLINRYYIKYFRPGIKLESAVRIAKKEGAIVQLIKELENHLKYIDNHDAFITLAELYGKDKDKTEKEKLSLLLDGLKRWPKSPEVHFNIANSYYKLGDLEKAKEYYASTVKLNRFEPPAYLNLGFIAFDEGDIEEAEKYFKKSLKYDNGYELPYYGLAIVFEKKSDKDKTVYYLKEYLKRASDERWKEIARKKLERLKKI